jgi:hypothetical protein
MTAVRSNAIQIRNLFGSHQKTSPGDLAIIIDDGIPIRGVSWKSYTGNVSRTYWSRGKYNVRSCGALRAVASTGRSGGVYYISKGTVEMAIYGTVREAMNLLQR